MSLIIYTLSRDRIIFYDLKITREARFTLLSIFIYMFVWSLMQLISTSAVRL